MKQIKRIFMAIVLICACNTHNCFAAQIINSCAATEPPCDTGCHEDTDTGLCVSDQLTPVVEDDPCWQYTGGMACLDSAETCYWNDIGGGNHVCSSTQIESCRDIDAVSVQLPRQTCSNATVGGQQCEWATSLGGLCRNKTTTVTCCDGTTASSASACPTCNTCAAITNTSMCTTYHASTLDCILDNGTCRAKTCSDLTQTNCTTYNTNWHCMWNSMQGCRTCNEDEYYDTTSKTCKSCTTNARYSDGSHYWTYPLALPNATSIQQCYAKYPSYQNGYSGSPSVVIEPQNTCQQSAGTGVQRTENDCHITSVTCGNGFYYSPVNNENLCKPCTNNSNGNGTFTGPGNTYAYDASSVSTHCPIKCNTTEENGYFYVHTVESNPSTETRAKLHTCQSCNSTSKVSIGSNQLSDGESAWLLPLNNASNDYGQRYTTGYASGYAVNCPSRLRCRKAQGDFKGEAYFNSVDDNTSTGYCIACYDHETLTPNQEITAYFYEGSNFTFCNGSYSSHADYKYKSCKDTSYEITRANARSECVPNIYTITLKPNWPADSTANNGGDTYLYEQHHSIRCKNVPKATTENPTPTTTEFTCKRNRYPRSAEQYGAPYQNYLQYVLESSNTGPANREYICCTSGIYTSSTPSCDTCIGVTHPGDSTHSGGVNQLTNLPRSTKQFLGYYDAQTGGNKIINADGTFVRTPSINNHLVTNPTNTLFSGNTTLYAQWGNTIEYTLKLKDTDNNEYLTQSCSGSICTLSTNNSNKMYQIATSSYTLGNNFVVNNVTMGKFYQDGNSVKFEIASGGLSAIDSATNTLTLTVGQKCAEGYYCQNLIATECPGQTTTEGTGATSVCQCTYFKMSTQVKDSFTSTNNKTSERLSKVLLYKDIRKSYINSSSSTTLCN